MKRNPITFIDARGNIVYVKGSRKNKTHYLSREAFLATNMLIWGTVTKQDGTVFYAPFRLDKSGSNK